MRSSLKPFEFFNKMKKKPALQKIVNNLSSYTVDDIQKSKQPKWIRDVLVELKLRAEGSVISVAKIAEIMQQKSKSKKDTNSYSAYRYIGMSKFIDSIEILENELILKINNKDKFLLAGKEIDSDKISPVVYVKDLVQYLDFAQLKHNDDWNRLCPGEEQLVNYNKMASSGKNYGMFQIRRIE